MSACKWHKRNFASEPKNKNQQSALLLCAILKQLRRGLFIILVEWAVEVGGVSPVAAHNAVIRVVLAVHVLAVL
jgi:hypothetical protein